MATEEIGLNRALADAGIEVTETDLGEYVVQLAGEHPAHIIAPAIEKTAEEVAELFAAVEGEPVDPTPEALTATARRRLREVFLTADVGITGVNFGVAETGSICLVENEGNARLVSTFPRVHVALMGMERVVPTLADLAVLLRLLARSATGQKITSYTTLLTGPAPRRRGGRPGGAPRRDPRQRPHAASSTARYREMLNCIRCGACINVCPIYRKTGGSAYGPVVSGPMGAVLAPLLAGLETAPDLPHASSLCGACTAACPVRIPLHELLLDLRRDLVAEDVAPRGERLAFALWSLAWSRPGLYRLSRAAARLARPLAGRIGPGRTWTRGSRAAADPTVSASRRAVRPRGRAGRVRRPPRRDARARGRRRSRMRSTGSRTPGAWCSPPRRTSRARRSLLPPAHVTRLREDAILPGLAELFAAVGPDLPSALAIVSGPSRSGDIEQRMIVGVHGPGEVHVVLVPAGLAAHATTRARSPRSSRRRARPRGAQRRHTAGALAGVAVGDDRPGRVGAAGREERRERGRLGVEDLRHVHVDRAGDVALARVARVARLAGELLRRADVEDGDGAVVEQARELVARHSTSPRKATQPTRELLRPLERGQVARAVEARELGPRDGVGDRHAPRRTG